MRCLVRSSRRCTGAGTGRDGAHPVARLRPAGRRGVAGLGPVVSVGRTGGAVAARRHLTKGGRVSRERNILAARRGDGGCLRLLLPYRRGGGRGAPGWPRG